MAERTFGASFLKIERAKRHLQELEAVIASYLDNDPATFSTRIEGRNVFYHLVEMKPVPLEASAIAGDIFHNLRSSLDLMAAELCGQPGQPDDDVYFPFAGEESELDHMIKKRNFDRAGAEAVRLLKEWKPYKGGNIALRAIHDLNVRDKHRMLIVHPVGFGGPIIDTRPPEGGLAIVGDPTKPSSVNLSFPADCALDGKDLVPTLHGLMDLTARIVESFKALG